MDYRMLGRTGIAVSELCLGTMTFGNSGERFKAINGLDQAAANALMERAIGAGINYFDTADTYSGGQSEEILGQSLRDLGVRRRDVVIATKFFSIMGAGPNNRGGSRAHIFNALTDSLERTGLDYLDHYQIHGFDPHTPIEETLRALDDLVSQGLIRYVGCSNWAAWQLMKALGISESRGWVRFETMQAYYSLAGRDIEREILPAMIDQEVGLTVWSPLAGGFLSGKYAGPDAPTDTRRAQISFPPLDATRGDACVTRMRGIADAHGATLPQIAIAWLLTRPGVSSVIIGAKTLVQLDDNIGATNVKLTPDDLAALEEVSALPIEYPGWMKPLQMVRRAAGMVI